MKLVELRKENIKEFKKLMKDAFQYGYESIYGKDKEQVLPDKDIDDNLKNPIDCYEEDDGMFRFEKVMK